MLNILHNERNPLVSYCHGNWFYAPQHTFQQAEGRNNGNSGRTNDGGHGEDAV